MEKNVVLIGDFTEPTKNKKWLNGIEKQNKTETDLNV